MIMYKLLFIDSSAQSLSCFHYGDASSCRSILTYTSALSFCHISFNPFNVSSMLFLSHASLPKAEKGKKKATFFFFLVFWPQFSVSWSGFPSIFPVEPSKTIFNECCTNPSLKIHFFFWVFFASGSFCFGTEKGSSFRRWWAPQGWVFCCVFGFCYVGVVVLVGLWWRRTAWRWLLRNRWRVLMNVQSGILGSQNMEEQWLGLWCTQRWIKRVVGASVLILRSSPSLEASPLSFFLIVEVSFLLFSPLT